LTESTALGFDLVKHLADRATLSQEAKLGGKTLVQRLVAHGSFASQLSMEVIWDDLRCGDVE
jgi:hypothetical protein